MNLEFQTDFLPDPDADLAEIAGRGPEFSGVRLDRRVELVNMILERFSAGVSQREIARVFGISRNSLSALVERATASGRLEPLKRRMSVRLGRLQESLTESLIEDVEENRLSPAQKPVALGIIIDKKLMLDGESSSSLMVEFRRIDISPERIREILLSIPSSDCESDAGVGNPADPPSSARDGASCGASSSGGGVQPGDVVERGDSGGGGGLVRPGLMKILMEWLARRRGQRRQPMDDGTLTQKQVAHRLGITEAQLRPLRAELLVVGEDLKKKGRMWCYCPAAVAKLALALAPGEAPRANATAPPCDLSEKDEATAVPGHQIAWVVRQTLNRTIVLARLDDGPEVVRVKVKDGTKFVPQMEVPVRAVNAAAGLYELARACPRWPGRW